MVQKSQARIERGRPAKREELCLAEVERALKKFRCVLVAVPSFQPDGTHNGYRLVTNIGINPLPDEPQPT